MMSRRAVVTGATRGLGLEIARLLAARGYRVVVIGRRDESVDSVVRALSGAGHEGWVCDLSRPESTRTLLTRLANRPVDLLINNAGASQFGPLDGLTADKIEEIIYLNLTAPALIAREFLRSARPGATLVNVSSIVATIPMPGNSVYSAAKAGLAALSESLWYEARRKGIRVLDFRPVSIHTEFHGRAGGGSMAGVMGVSAETAARDLVRALERGRSFAFPHGFVGRALGLVNRLLPRRLLVSQLGRKSARSGYLP
jgi:short-subunit dehydrogenase